MNRYGMTIYWADAPKSYSPEFVSSPSFAKAFRSTLIRAYRAQERPKIVCSCPGRKGGDRRLSVKHHNDTDTYFLARYPNTGPNHARDCMFFAPDSRSCGLSAYHERTIRHDDDGLVHVNIEPSVIDGLASSNQPAGNKRGSQSGKKREKATVKGLLDLLLFRSEISVWHPGMAGKRKYGTVSYMVLEASGHIHVARGLPLRDVLLVSSFQKDGILSKHNKEVVNRVAGARKGRTLKVVVFGFLAPRQALSDSISQGGGGVLEIKGGEGIPSVRLDDDLAQHLMESHPAAVRYSDKGGTVCFLTLGRLSENGASVHAESIAMVRMASGFIPYDNYAEARIIRKMIDEGRSFEKVLQFDDERTRLKPYPDFYMLDTSPICPLVIYPFDDDKRDRDARLKRQAILQKEFSGHKLWEWHAYRDREPPSLPHPAANR